MHRKHTLIFALASLGTNWTVFVTFIVFDIALIDIALILALIGAGLSNTAITDASGYVEMLLAALAWYIVMAEVVNETLGRPVFPLFPFRKA